MIGEAATADRAAEKISETDEALEATPLTVWAARLSVLMLARGGLLLLAYAIYGFDTDPNDFALGFRLDPLNAAIQCLWGAAGTIIGFYRPRFASIFVLAFAIFYSIVVLLGMLTPYDLAANVGDREHLLYMFMAVSGWAVWGYALWQDRDAGR